MEINEQDQFLIRGLAEENKTIIEKIYKDNYSMVQNMVLTNFGTSDDAADIFQEAMIVLFEKSINPEFQLHCQLKTYLYSVCKRLWLKKLQRDKRLSIQTNDFEQTVLVEEDIEYLEKRQQDFQLMETAMNKIGEPCKSLLEAFYIQKKQMQQIAVAFNYTNADNAKTQKYKCLIRLKKLFFAAHKNG